MYTYTYIWTCVYIYIYVYICVLLFYSGCCCGFLGSSIFCRGSLAFTFHTFTVVDAVAFSGVVFSRGSLFFTFRT